MKSEVSVLGNCLQVNRVFGAPRPQVFAWWTSAANLSKWSYCKEATSCEVEMDFRVGGSFTQRLMIGDVCALLICGTYKEIVEPERIVYDATFGEATAHVVIEFSEHPGGTRVALTHEHFNEEGYRSAVAQGTCESLEFLSSLLAHAPQNV
jgi:uncharacterized protein YndB with AHSA1/START domain